MNVENPLNELLGKTDERELNEIRKELNLAEDIKAILGKYQKSTHKEIRYVHPKSTTSHEGFYKAYQSFIAQEKGLIDPTSIPLHDLDFTNLRLALSEYKDLVQYDEVDETLNYWEKQEPPVEDNPIEEDTKQILDGFRRDDEQWELDRLAFQRRQTTSDLVAWIEETFKTEEGRWAARKFFDPDQEPGDVNTANDPTGKSDEIVPTEFVPLKDIQPDLSSELRVTPDSKKSEEVSGISSEDEENYLLPPIFRRRRDSSTPARTGSEAETRTTTPWPRVIRLSEGFDQIPSILGTVTGDKVTILVSPDDLVRYAKGLTIPIRKGVQAKINELDYRLLGGPEGKSLTLSGRIGVKGMGFLSAGSIGFECNLRNDPLTGDVTLSSEPTYNIPRQFKKWQGDIEENIRNIHLTLMGNINSVVGPDWRSTELIIDSDLRVNLVRSNAAEFKYLIP